MNIAVGVGVFILLLFALFLWDHNQCEDRYFDRGAPPELVAEYC